jgi:hypothetical protein
MVVSTDEDPLCDLWLPLLNGRVTVQIFIRSDWENSEASMFEGLADIISLDPVNRTARIQGRDYSSILINSTYQNSFCNQTASEVASHIASRHGFGQNIVTTSTMIGTYQGEGYSQILLNAHSHITSEWDLLKYLAEQEGFKLFVNGTNLVFSPASLIEQNHILLGYSNVSEMRFSRICPLSENTTLVVKSWDSWLDQASVCSNAMPSNTSPTAFTGLVDVAGIELAIVRPNLSPKSAQELSSRYMEGWHAQEQKIEIVMPGETVLKPCDIVSISETGTLFDADYVINSIRRQYSCTSGFTEHIHGVAA